jgi:hypothetical protein
MLVETCKLCGIVLDWAVAKCETDRSRPVGSFLDGVVVHPELSRFHPSASWTQAGPIIEREQINLIWSSDHPVRATVYQGGEIWVDADGPSPLIAAMRCYVQTRFGHKLDIPDYIIEKNNLDTVHGLGYN